jgi:hypothetical protein
MKRHIREIEDSVYKEFIQDLLNTYPTFKEDKYKFEPVDDLSSDETYKNKYLRLQNTIRLSNSVRENTNMYGKNPKMKTKLQELINQLVREELSLMEKKKKKEEPIDLDLDIDTPTGDEDINIDSTTSPADDTMDLEMDSSMDMGGGTGDEKEIGNHLQAALEAAKKLPDSETKSKLIRQIGNTALFFLKTQIPTGDQG